MKKEFPIGYARPIIQGKVCPVQFGTEAFKIFCNQNADLPEYENLYNSQETIKQLITAIQKDLLIFIYIAAKVAADPKDPPVNADEIKLWWQNAPKEEMLKIGRAMDDAGRLMQYEANRAVNN